MSKWLAVVTASESEVVEELVAAIPTGKRRSPNDLLKGKLSNLITDADFEGLHEDMLSATDRKRSEGRSRLPYDPVVSQRFAPAS